MPSAPDCHIYPHHRYCQNLSAPQNPFFYLLASLQQQMGHGSCRVLRSISTEQVTTLWRTSQYSSRVTSSLAPRASNVSASSRETADSTGWWPCLGSPQGAHGSVSSHSLIHHRHVGGRAGAGKQHVTTSNSTPRECQETQEQGDSWALGRVGKGRSGIAGDQCTLTRSFPLHC